MYTYPHGNTQKGDTREQKETDQENVMNAQILLLDATYQPLRVISTRRAVGLLLKGSAEGVTEEAVQMRSADAATEVPLVLRLGYSVTIPFKRQEIQCNRRAVLARDGHICQFIVNGKPCNERAETIDHVHPQSKGGGNVWENLVASCKAHNHKKSDRSLADLGWKLKREPYAPRNRIRVVDVTANIPEAWKPYLAYA